MSLTTGSTGAVLWMISTTRAIAWSSPLVIFWSATIVETR